jgi:hypothetical protein
MINYAFLQFSDCVVFLYYFLLLLFREGIAGRFPQISRQSLFLGMHTAGAAASSRKTGGHKCHGS